MRVAVGPARGRFGTVSASERPSASLSPNPRRHSDRGTTLSSRVAVPPTDSSERPAAEPPEPATAAAQRPLRQAPDRRRARIRSTSAVIVAAGATRRRALAHHERVSGLEHAAAVWGGGVAKDAMRPADDRWTENFAGAAADEPTPCDPCPSKNPRCGLQWHAPPLTSCCSPRQQFRVRSEATFSGGPIWRPE